MNEGPLEALIGCRIRRVDRPADDLLALTLGRSGEKHVLLLSTSPPAVGCVELRPRGLPAEGLGKRLRNHLEGAVLRRAIAIGSALAIDLSRGGEAIGLVHEWSPPSNVFVLDGDGAIRVALRPGPPTGAAWPGPSEDALELEIGGSLEELRAAGETLLEQRRDAGFLERAKQLDRALRSAAKRLSRRAEATWQDLERAETVPSLRAHASSLLTIASSLPRDASHARITDWSSDPPRDIEIAIDPIRGALGTAEAMFKRARKLETGATIAARRHDEAAALSEAIGGLRARLESATELEQVESLEREALSLSEPIRIQVTTSQKSGKAIETRQPYRRYFGSGERAILVGRTSVDNDTLTFRVARPHDLWLHVRGAPGSHVIVPMRKGETCPPELLIDAAHLAAHFSTMRDHDPIEVQHTRRSMVRKPKGARPGAVSVTQERVLALRIETERLARLLAIS